MQSIGCMAECLLKKIGGMLIPPLSQQAQFGSVHISGDCDNLQLMHDIVVHALRQATQQRLRCELGICIRDLQRRFIVSLNHSGLFLVGSLLLAARAHACSKHGACKESMKERSIKRTWLQDGQHLLRWDSTGAGKTEAEHAAMRGTYWC